MEHITDVRVHDFSWGSVIAGVTVALAIQALLNLLGLGLGFTAFTVNTDVMTGIGIGSIIWLIMSGIIAMFCGGWVAGRISEVNYAQGGILHGFVAWCVANLILFALIATTAGALISGMASAIGQGIALAGKSVTVLSQGAIQAAPQLAKTAQNVLPDFTPAIQQIVQQANQSASQASAINSTDSDTSAMEQQQLTPDQFKEQLSESITQLLTASDDNGTSTAQQNLVNFLVNNTAMDQQQAEQTVSDWQAKYNAMKVEISQKAEQAKQTAINTAEQTSNDLGTLAIIGSLSLFLGAIASAVGGMVGATNVRKVTAYSKDSTGT